jgi:hypothetical protein
MIRVTLVVLIVLLGADVIFYNGKYTQAASNVAAAIWRSAAR